MTSTDRRNSRPCSAFQGGTCLASGALADVAVKARAFVVRHPAAAILFFDDETGALVEVDLRGTPAEIRRRIDAGAATTRPPAETAAPVAPRGPGRPKLGVVAREVTLLPRHWEWLGSQPGGASVALRRLVDEARRTHGGASARRRAQEAAYRFMTAVAGDYPGYEEALRALFAGDADRFEICVRPWPADVRAYARRLADGALGTREEAS